MIVRLVRTDENMERNPTAEIMREFINEVVHNAMEESAEYEDDVISDFVFYIWAVNDSSMLWREVNQCQECGEPVGAGNHDVCFECNK